jgi:hypothetical protein
MLQRKNFVQFDGHALVCAALVASVLACTPVHAESPTPQGASRDPAARIALFGDLHVHTALSLDAYLTGTLTGPDEAYRFAQGEAIRHPAGFSIQLERPFDFLAVTDHAGFLGMPRAMDDANSGPGTHPLAVRLRQAKTQAERLQVYYDIWPYWDPKGETGFTDPGPDFVDDLLDMDVVRSAWQEVIDAAERYNRPGEFTTFVGYEYTAYGPMRRNLHRNVIFEGSRVPSQPFREQDSQNPEDLWDWMDNLRAQGMEALAIPHNSNGSDGIMFAKTDWQGQRMDAAYTEQRMRNEPLVEVTQNKGTSETHPLLSPDDEWAHFELWEIKIAASEPSRPQGSYVRQAYLDGLVMQQTRQVNPYRFGLIGASDTHVAAGSFDESNYWGSGAASGTAEERGSVPMRASDGGEYVDTPARSASGMTGVWAEENTRESIYAAQRRKETFATSGPRIRVRFFAGYGWDKGFANSPNAISLAYASGVSMGGELAARNGDIPAFLVWATRDANSVPLQRLQVVKGWVEHGESRERVYDVACSDGLTVDPETRRCPDNGASVRLQDCRVTADVGASQLRTLWRDPDFDPGQPAFYYVRVLENPSCRWSTWDAIRAGVAPRPDWPATIQERAWSSPIWYVP